MSLYESEYRNFIKELLDMFDYEEIMSLSHTATYGKIHPENREEAESSLLLHTADLDRLFSYRKITAQVLFKYLHDQKISVDRSATKNQLISNTIKLWRDRAHNAVSTKNATVRKFRSLSTPDSSKPIESVGYRARSTSITTLNTSESSQQLEKVVHIRSDIFAKEFCKWFYTMLNRLQQVCRNQPGDTFDSNVFCSNCFLQVFLLSVNKDEEKNASGQANCTELLKSILNKYQLLFNPNIDGGCVAMENPHGMVRIACCGTLHHENEFVGVFEQEIDLVKSPINQSWKIVNTRVNLKQTSNRNLPTLPDIKVFQIES